MKGYGIRRFLGAKRIINGGTTMKSSLKRRQNTARRCKRLAIPALAAASLLGTLAQSAEPIAVETVRIETSRNGSGIVGPRLLTGSPSTLRSAAIEPAGEIVATAPAVSARPVVPRIPITSPATTRTETSDDNLPPVVAAAAMPRRPSRPATNGAAPANAPVEPARPLPAPIATASNSASVYRSASMPSATVPQDGPAQVARRPVAGHIKTPTAPVRIELRRPQTVTVPAKKLAPPLPTDRAGWKHHADTVRTP